VLGGTVAVESEVGRGTKFTVTIPFEEIPRTTGLRATA
jgi:signal transduction histidine kinase